MPLPSQEHDFTTFNPIYLPYSLKLPLLESHMLVPYGEYIKTYKRTAKISRLE